MMADRGTKQDDHDKDDDSSSSSSSSSSITDKTRTDTNHEISEEVISTAPRKRKRLPRRFWYKACKTFLSHPEKYNHSQTEFLRSSDSGSELQASDQVVFGRRLKEYKEGTLLGPSARTETVTTTKKNQQQQQKRQDALRTWNEGDGISNAENGNSKLTLKRRRRDELPVNYWYEMCKKFMENGAKYNNSQVCFLRSPDSGPHLDESQGMAFGKRLRLYKLGKLETEDGVRKRFRTPKFEDVERCLLAFLDARQSFSTSKMAVSWPFLLELSKRFAVALGYPEGEFRASPG